MKTEFTGSILLVREVEDCIRATRKYTKGLFRKSIEHPIQGAEFPSKMLTEYYEVYPDVDLRWDMPAKVAWAWVWGDKLHIDVLFKYDYRSDKALVLIQNGPKMVEELVRAISGFGDALSKLAVGNGNRR